MIRRKNKHRLRATIRAILVVGSRDNPRPSKIKMTIKVAIRKVNETF